MDVCPIETTVPTYNQHKILVTSFSFLSLGNREYKTEVTTYLTFELQWLPLVAATGSVAPHLQCWWT